MVVALCGVMFAACERGGGGESSGEQRAAREKPDPARGIKVSVRYPPDERIREAHYVIDYRPGSGYDLEASLLEPLQAAVRADLVPSDGPKSCRYSDGLPWFEIHLPKVNEGDSDVRLVSTSHCQDFAPWNVIVDGKLYVQLSGAIGRALRPVLVELDSLRFEHYRWPSEARFELTANAGTLPEDVTVQTPPWLTLEAALVEHPGFAATFGKEARVGSLRILCSQAVSADCSELLGQARLPWRGHELELGSTLALDKVLSIDMPESGEGFDALLGSKLFAAFSKSAAGATITLAYDKRGDCRNVERAAETYAPGKAASELGCEFYSALVEPYEGATQLPPQIFYYPSLGAARLNNWVDRTDLGFYKSLGAPEKIGEAILLEKTFFFSTLDGKLTQIER